MRRESDVKKKKGCERMSPKKKVVVIDNSAFMRRVISDIINDEGRCEVVGTASNGRDGLKLIEEVQPDVVTLDIQMPIMDGLTMLKRMKKSYDIPVIMLSTLTKEGAAETIQSLELGAFDFVAKPEDIFRVNSQETRKELMDKILAAIQYNVTYPQVKKNNSEEIQDNIKYIQESKSLNTLYSKSRVKNLIAIGTSTGGPRALQSVLPHFPEELDGAIVIVQHMPPGFITSLAERLDHLSHIRVKEAEHGEVVCNGIAYVAPGDLYLRVKSKGERLIIHLSDEQKKGAHKPSVNIMMESLQGINVEQIIAVVMTGMGTDGRDGIAVLKSKKKAYIIAQDETSCVVYGMPRAIVEAKLVDKIAPLDEIACVITRKMEVL